MDFKSIEVTLGHPRPKTEKRKDVYLSYKGYRVMFNVEPDELTQAGIRGLKEQFYKRYIKRGN